MLEIKNLSYEVAEKLIISDLNFCIQKGECVGLVGPNGAGKSTFLKIIAGLESPTSGSIIRGNNVSVVYFPQELAQDDRKLTIAGYFKARRRVIREYEMESALNRVGLSGLELSRKLDTLSGGQRTKLFLAAVISSDSDVVLLDEPTNNLDLEGIGVLEKFIKQAKKSFVVVSHDRRFLRNVAERILYLGKEAEEHKVFPGGYDEFQSFRKAEENRHGFEYTAYINEKRRLEIAAKGQRDKALAASKSNKLHDNDKGAFKARKQRATNSLMGAARAIESRAESLEEVKKPRKKIDLNYAFADNNLYLGSDIFEFADARFRYPGSNVSIGPITLKVMKGDRLVILGSNGVGKTTIIRALLGELVPQTGSLRVGPSVRFGLIDQEQTLPLPDGSFLDNLKVLIKSSAIDEKGEGKLRELLHRFGFSAELNTSASKLSPGERSRLLLAALAIQGCNVLLFDEPTNHLDVEAAEELEQALKEYGGTYVIISHDREFISNLNISRRIEFTDLGLREL